MNRKYITFSYLLLLILLAGCSSMPAIEIINTEAAPSVTPFPAPVTLESQNTPTPSLPTATETASAPQASQLILEAIPASEKGQAPDYTLSASTPRLTGYADPRIDEFNRLVAAIVKRQVDGFKYDLANLPPQPIAAGSFFETSFSLLSPPGNVLSLKFDINGYSDGAAHPYHFSETFTFDLEKSQPLTLEQLFIPGSNYLETISSYCINELTTRGLGPDVGFINGADPLPENYRNWNITPNGLLITFDEYQVGPYAAGPQSITIPYAELAAVIDPNGALGRYLK